MTSSPLDPIAILGALGIDNPSFLEPVSGGFDTAIWRVVHDGHTYALRVFRPGQQGTWECEKAAMRAVAGHLSTPAVHRAEILGERAALLLDWCPGLPLLHQLRDASADVEKLGAAFGRMQAQIHAVPAPDDWPADSWIQRCGPDQDPLQEKLRTLTTDTPTLLHLDYHPMNVMTDGSEITAVLDWANAAAGDPRADYARTYTILHFADIGAPELLQVFAQGWQDGYLERVVPLEEMDLFFAWAGAYTVRDLAPKIDELAPIFTPERLVEVARWADGYQRRAGLIP